MSPRGVRATPVDADAWRDLMPAGTTDGAHRIADITYATETIVCTCSLVVTAAPDPLYRDRHQPLVDAWAVHRSAARGAKLAAKAARRRAGQAAASNPMHDDPTPVALAPELAVR